MRITSELICQAADQLQGFVGLNRKTGQYIVRFSEDSFGMDVADDGIIPTAEFVWLQVDGQAMTLSRERIQLLLDQNIDDRINITEPLRVYMRRVEIPPPGTWRAIHECARLSGLTRSSAETSARVKHLMWTREALW